MQSFEDNIFLRDIFKHLFNQNPSEGFTTGSAFPIGYSIFFRNFTNPMKFEIVLEIMFISLFPSIAQNKGLPFQRTVRYHLPLQI